MEEPVRSCPKDPRCEIVEYGRKLHQRSFVAATDGNLSVRLKNGNGFLSTPTGMPKEELEPDHLAEIDSEGKTVSGKPSSEWQMHYEIYRARPDVNAVVHAHPPFATVMACTGRAIDRPFLSEAIISLGNVPLVPFSLPSTVELARSVGDSLKKHNAALLANHGSVTVGPDLRTAYYRMETLEQTARILCYTEMLGGGSPLPEPSINRLKKMGMAYGLSPAPCPGDGSICVSGGDEKITLSREELIGLLVDFASLYCKEGIE